MSSVIAHPAEQPLVIIRAEYLAICDGNHCAAAILNLFEFWTKIKVNNQQQAVIRNDLDRQRGETPSQDTSLWVYKTNDEVCQELLGLFGLSAVKTALKNLVKVGFLHKRKNPANGWDRTLQYLLDIDFVQMAVNILFPPLVENNQSIGQIQPIDKMNTTNRLVVDNQAIPKNTTKTTAKITAKTKPPVAPRHNGEPSDPAVVQSEKEKDGAPKAAVEKPDPADTLFAAIGNHICDANDDWNGYRKTIVDYQKSLFAEFPDSKPTPDEIRQFAVWWKAKRKDGNPLSMPSPSKLPKQFRTWRDKHKARPSTYQPSTQNVISL